MPIFEVTAVGFDAESDATDNRVLWVQSDSLETLTHVLQGVPRMSVTVMPAGFNANHDDIDHATHFHGGRELLRSALHDFAKG